MAIVANKIPSKDPHAFILLLKAGELPGIDIKAIWNPEMLTVL